MYNPFEKLTMMASLDQERSGEVAESTIEAVDDGSLDDLCKKRTTSPASDDGTRPQGLLAFNFTPPKKARPNPQPKSRVDPMATTPPTQCTSLDSAILKLRSIDDKIQQIIDEKKQLDNQFKEKDEQLGVAQNESKVLKDTLALDKNSINSTLDRGAAFERERKTLNEKLERVEKGWERSILRELELATKIKTLEEKLEKVERDRSASENRNAALSKESIKLKQKLENIEKGWNAIKSLGSVFEAEP